LAALCGPLCGGPLLCGPLCRSPRRLLLAAFCSAFLRHSFPVICLSFAASAAVLSHTYHIRQQRMDWPARYNVRPTTYLHDDLPTSTDRKTAFPYAACTRIASYYLYRYPKFVYLALALSVSGALAPRAYPGIIILSYFTRTCIIQTLTLLTLALVYYGTRTSTRRIIVQVSDL